MVWLSLMLACETSKIPPDSAHFTVTAAAPDGGGSYAETFEYYLSFDASTALVYIGEDAFARGTFSGCTLTYESVVVGQDTDNGSVKWQLFGEAEVETVDGDPCVDGGDDWAGSEYFEIIASEDETIEVGTDYNLLTTGSFDGFTE